MKQAISIFLAALLLCLGLCGCQKNGDAPSGMIGLVDENNEYTLYVPDKWLADDSRGMTAAYRQDTKGVSVSVYAVGMSSNTNSAQAYWESYRETFDKTFDDFTTDEGKDIKLNDLDARKYVYSGTVGGEAYSFIQVICVRNAVIYIMTLSAPTEQFAENEPTFAQIIDVFAFR